MQDMAYSRNRTAEPKEILGLNRITKKRILELCKKNKLYQTPSLNDVLYLHYQGFESIECLEEYTGLKCLWLECNAISEIQGLDNQIKLKCLFLQSNLIKKIENLEYCKELDTINLSQNHIRKIENCGFDILPVLNTLNISSNYIKDSEGLKELENCISLSVLDLSNNRIDDILVVKIFNKMPELKVLVLQGNPVVSKIPQYRKTLTLECKKLTYLDSRPVFPKDRACAEAWKRGGYEEERKENERWNRRERKKMRDSVNATIRMRNKNRKPEDILALLTSSDSENESDATKTRRQNDLGNIDSIWDEVAEDSSDLNVSSSTSETSTTDSNGQDNNSGGCADNAEKTTKMDEQKILNDGFENNSKACPFAEYDHMESNIQFENEPVKEKPDIDVKQIVEQYETIELKKHDNHTVMRADQEFDMKIQAKKIKIDHGDLLLGKYTAENIDSSEKGFSLNESSSSHHSYNSQYSDEDQYKDTINAICHAAMNNLSETDNFSTTPLRSVQLQIETLNVIDNENYEPLKELEETMNTLTRKEDLEKESTRQDHNMLTIEPPAELQVAQECPEINHELQKHFEKLSSDMDNFMLQLQKDKVERQEAMEVLLDTKETPMESRSESSENEDDLEEWKLENMVNRLMKGKRIVEARSIKDVPDIWINDKPCQLESMGNIEDCEESCTNSQQETCVTNKEIREEVKSKLSEDGIPQDNKQDVSNYDNTFTDIENSPKNTVKTHGPPAEIKTDLTKEQLFLPANLSHENKVNAFPADTLSPIAVDSDESDFEYIPMDITLLTRNSQDALNSFEKEAKELKVLLQKLEDENMDLFKEINTEIKCHAEENSKENSFKDVQEDKLQEEYKEESNKIVMKIILQENVAEQLMGSLEELEIEKLEEQEILRKNEIDDEIPKPSVGEQLIEEIIQCLELKPFKPKSYEFDIMSDEEYSYSESIVEKEDLPSLKSIPDFLESFALFSKTISNEKKIPTTDKQKINCIQEPAYRRKLQDFNNDDHKVLDEQLELLKEEQTKKVRRMVDRVYAQKERYNDTLEVIDGKLMVRNKDTGEVKEIPSPSRHLSDSDSEYDTAQSDEEEEGATYCGKSRQLIDGSNPQSDLLRNYESTNDQRLRNCEGNWGFNRHSSDGWPISYKPTQQTSAESLITQALEQNRRSDLTRIENDSSSDESNDEFHSLDQQKKPNPYGNIDKEFFNTLTLGHFNLSEQDEHHMNQSARSYEDMNKFLKLNKDEKCSINENNEILDKIKKRTSREIEGNHENVSQILSNNDDCTKNDLLLNKLLQRTKEKVVLEIGNIESNRNIHDVEVNRMPYKICKDPFKIYEYKYQNNDHNASSSNPPVNASYETQSSTETVMDNNTEVFGNNVYSFIFEEEERTTESIGREKREQESETEFVENEEVLNRQDFIKNLLLRNISFQKVKAEEEKLSSTDLNSPKSADSILCLEKYSEEEKNEIESNVDVEGIVMNNNLEFVPEKECLEKTSNHEYIPNTEYNIITGETSSLNASALKKLTDSKNCTIVRNEAYLQEQQILEEHINTATDLTTQSRATHHVLDQYDLLRETPKSSEKQCLEEMPVHDNASSEYRTSNTPPISKVATQEITEKLSTDNYTVNSENSTENSQILQVNPVNTETSSQNATYYSEVNCQQPENEPTTTGCTNELPSSFYINQFQDHSENQESIESLETTEHGVLECNLEIIGCNDEIIDTITVNAELHYEY